MQISRQSIISAATHRLHEMAKTVPCLCRPYRGGSSKARHFHFCVWDSWYDGFLDGLAVAGVEEHELPDVEIQPLRRR